ncbi:hypothetical protein OSB04_019893 [Centaurea solstitialis]|uniref:Uncharacterized protein n=1 Tax=Centaurea solstitialis TaxID=347529 RepID=A0AA38SR73_9ASTR|nr:hypothetical protein OSB04_019893 [Centaurea solstitialis]
MTRKQKAKFSSLPNQELNMKVGFFCVDFRLGSGLRGFWLHSGSTCGIKYTQSCTVVIWWDFSAFEPSSSHIGHNRRKVGLLVLHGSSRVLTSASRRRCDGCVTYCAYCLVSSCYTRMSGGLHASSVLVMAAGFDSSYVEVTSVNSDTVKEHDPRESPLKDRLNGSRL